MLQGARTGQSPQDAERARRTWEAVVRSFYQGHGLFVEEIGAGEPATSFNWPFGAAWTAALTVARLPGAEGELARRMLPELREGARAYWDDRAGRVPGYASAVRDSGGGDRFYDDNAWMGLNHVRDAALGGGDAALRQAEATWRFVWSGWDERLGGGIYWCERDRASKNTCCSGPAAVLAVRLYEETGRPAYLQQARALVEWTQRTLQDPTDGLYWDHIRVEDGRIERTKWSYNAGTLISAGVLLSRHAGAQWLAAARRTAEAAVRHFAPDGLYSGSVWFHSVLFRGLALLASSEGRPEFLEAVGRSLDHAWEVARDERDLVYPDWRQGNGRGGRLKLLDAVPYPEVCALLALAESPTA